MNNPAVQSYIDKWLSAHPAQQLSLPFVPNAHRDTYLALAALELELVVAAFGASEPEVAATKLNWWLEELSGAVISGGRHPLVKQLFTDETIRTMDASLWIAPITAAINQLEAATPADFDTQFEVTHAFFGGIAQIETHLWYGPHADAGHAGNMATLTHLLYTTTRLNELLESERLPLPMSLLAKHGLNRDTLSENSAARRDAVRSQLNHLHTAWKQASKQKGPLSIFRGLDARLGYHWLKKAKRAKDPLATLRRTQERQTGFGTLWRAWKAGQQQRRQS